MGWSPRTRCPSIQSTHAAGRLPFAGRLNWASMLGSDSSDEAKMTGMTPAMLTFSGM